MRVTHIKQAQTVAAIMDYPTALYWILRNRGGGGGHPPRDIGAVSGWMLVRFTAALFGRNPREVAADLIDAHNMAEGHG